MRDIELRLIGHPSPSGKVEATTAVDVTDAMRALMYRLTRLVAERPGLGRANASVERASVLRLGLAEGSTRMIFTIGEEHTLVDDPWAPTVDEEFWALVQGMLANECPAETPPTVADAVDDLVKAVKTAAPTVEVSVPGRGPVVVQTKHLDRAPWQAHRIRTAEPTTVVGTLEMVDLRSARFRLRDLVGNAIELIDVEDAEAAGKLVGQQVTASGTLERGDGQRHHRMESATIESHQLSQAVLALVPTHADLETLAAAARAMPDVDPLELSDEDFDEFWTAIHA